VNLGLVLVAFGALLSILHASVLPTVDRAVSRRRPGSRFASAAYIAWRRHHRRAGLVGALAVTGLGLFVAVLL
jgi:hypothetical protein